METSLLQSLSARVYVNLPEGNCYPQVPLKICATTLLEEAMASPPLLVRSSANKSCKCRPCTVYTMWAPVDEIAKLVNIISITLWFMFIFMIPTFTIVYNKPTFT